MRLHGRRLGIITFLCALLLLLAGVAGLFGWLISTPQGETGDFPPPGANAPLPSPNGYEDFLAAAGAVSDKVEAPSSYSTQRKEAVLAENAKALALVRKGLPKEARLPSISLSPSVSFAVLRVERLFLIEASLAESKEHLPSVCRSYLDLFRFATQRGQGGTNLEMIGSNAGTILAIQGLDATPENVPAELVPRIALEMEATHAGAYPYRLVEARNYERWKMDRGNPDPRSVVQLAAEALAQARAKKYFSDLAKLSTSTSLKKAAARMAEKWQDLPLDFTGFGMTIGDEVGYIDKWYLANATVRLTFTKYALRAFLLKYGRYPDSLEALVPEFLKAAPVDPYSGNALVYRRTETGYLLYSVGPDGVDNGGKPYTGARTPTIDIAEAVDITRPPQPASGEQ